MAEDKFTVQKIIFYVYCVILFFLGLAALGVGLWMNADRDMWAYLFVYQRAPDDYLLSSSTICLIVVGIIIAVLAFVGFIGVFFGKTFMLTLFVVCLFFVFVWEATLGFMLVEYRVEMFKRDGSIEKGMISTIMYEYKYDNRVGKAWNRVQVREKCCGASIDFSDYLNSQWWRDNNPEGTSVIDKDAKNVPDTCCKLIPDQDRDTERVNPQKPQVKDYARCSEFAGGRNRFTDFVHRRTCYAALFGRNFNYLNINMALDLTIAFFALTGMIYSIIFFSQLKAQSEDKY